jgi:hypothetical protein
VQYFIHQALRGLKYIHSANVLHRDLVSMTRLVSVALTVVLETIKFVDQCGCVIESSVAMLNSCAVTVDGLDLRLWHGTSRHAVGSA